MNPRNSAELLYDAADENLRLQRQDMQELEQDIYRIVDNAHKAGIPLADCQTIASMMGIQWRPE